MSNKLLILNKKIYFNNCPDDCLVFQPNAVGLRWQELMRSRWSTHATLTPAAPGTAEWWSVPAYHGQYEVTAWRAGAEVAPAQTVRVTPGVEDPQVTVIVNDCDN